ncbi:hypothetical protein QQM39_03035 [Streptomyces sp. DT2A-34]|uniref:hypothetical protein n=1 Tax=Streptomyces sp. DT2A-34 TaxID=3051182 RepID=UPI00265BDDB6|nr:hypothetical protein [Streptomyces sp. DT2A-34]MDO0909871.1 hypothetical protein [Streptomyces sp. DT2A-34]
MWQKFIEDNETAIRHSAVKEAVGELWQPEDLWSGTAWRDMDGRARRRRIGRAVGVVASVIIVSGTASHLSAGSGDEYEGHRDVTSQQTENSRDELTTVSEQPSAPTSAGASSPAAPTG